MDKTILIVDDNLINHRILFRILQNAQYQVLEAMNGKEALDLIESGSSQVNIILLDLVMPVMDGHELLRKMKENGLIHKIPVIILTGNEEQQTEIRCLKEGASDFLIKPYNPDVLRHHVRKAVEERDFIKLKQEYLRNR